MNPRRPKRPKRRHSSVSPGRVIRVFTEGEKTEPTYLLEWKRRTQSDLVRPENQR